MTELASQELIRVSAWPTIPCGSITPEYSGYLRVPKSYNQIEGHTTFAKTQLRMCTLDSHALKWQRCLVIGLRMDLVCQSNVILETSSVVTSLVCGMIGCTKRSMNNFNFDLQFILCVCLRTSKILSVGEFDTLTFVPILLVFLCRVYSKLCDKMLCPMLISLFSYLKWYNAWFRCFWCV